MLASFMTKIRTIELREVPVPQPKHDEVLIRVQAVGVCGSDVHLFIHGALGSSVVIPPYILGHEASGTVAAVGKDVKHLHVGDRIVMEPGIPCGHCHFCQSGRYNLCPDVQFWAAPPVPGVIAQFVVHKADFCYRISDTVDYAVASLAEPLSVGVYAAMRSHATPGKKAAILGSGPIGLTSLIAANSFGLSDVMVSDVFENRLQIARDSGAKHVVNANTANLLHEAEAFTQKEGFDIVFETSGALSAAQDAINIAKRGSTVVLIGSLPDEGNLPLLRINMKELQVIGSFRYANTFPVVVNILENKPQLGKLITHRFPIEQTQDAFLFAHEHKDKCVKVVIAT